MLCVSAARRLVRLVRPLRSHLHSRPSLLSPPRRRAQQQQKKKKKKKKKRLGFIGRLLHPLSFGGGRGVCIGAAQRKAGGGGGGG